MSEYYKVTVMDVATGEVVSEVIEQWGWPSIMTPYYLPCGRSGIPVAVERVLRPAPENIHDNTPKEG